MKAISTRLPEEASLLLRLHDMQVGESVDFSDTPRGRKARLVVVGTATPIVMHPNSIGCGYEYEGELSRALRFSNGGILVPFLGKRLCYFHMAKQVEHHELESFSEAGIALTGKNLKWRMLQLGGRRLRLVDLGATAFTHIEGTGITNDNKIFGWYLAQEQGSGSYWYLQVLHERRIPEGCLWTGVNIFGTPAAFVENIYRNL